MDSIGSLPKVRGNLLNLAGWGYKDSGFKLSNGEFTFSGKRYSITKPGIPYESWVTYVEENFGIVVKNLMPVEKVVQLEENYPPRLENLEFLDNLEKFGIESSIDFDERLFRSHGQSTSDIFMLNFDRFPRVADLILFPKCHSDVEKIVKFANQCNVVLIPVGGCTNVSESSTCPEAEARMIAVVDCTQMSKMLWIDEENFLASFESGVIGQDLEKLLNLKGFTLGHEPDSIELSSLGGWISTKASGMKQQKYGNIEKMMNHVKLVTSVGTINKKVVAPRVSMGPDIENIVLGSEGVFGIITEVILRIHPEAEFKKYGSIIFHNLETGIDCLREIGKSSSLPTNIRLVDNFHFQMSSFLKQHEGKFSKFLENLKRNLLSVVKGYDLKKIAVATYVYEGNKNDVLENEGKLIKISKKFDGFSAGEEYGRIGYQMTFFIAYVRDMMIDLGVFAESYETSVVWSKSKSLYKNIVDAWNGEMEKRSIKLHQFGFRISQVYHEGVCCYFYFGFRLDKIDKETHEIHKEVRNNLLKNIRASGGALSHHHGIGKKLKAQFQEISGDVEMKILKALKKEIDPKNIFAASNLITEDKSDVLLSKL